MKPYEFFLTHRLLFSIEQIFYSNIKHQNEPFQPCQKLNVQITITLHVQIFMLYIDKQMRCINIFLLFNLFIVVYVLISCQIIRTAL